MLAWKRNKEEQVVGPSSLGRAPNFVMCYICGRKYGSSSLLIHVKACERLFLQTEARKHPSERRKLPAMPTILAKKLAAQGMHGQMTAKEIEAINEAATKTHEKEIRSSIPKPQKNKARTSVKSRVPPSSPIQDASAPPRAPSLNMESVPTVDKDVNIEIYAPPESTRPKYSPPPKMPTKIPAKSKQGKSPLSSSTEVTLSARAKASTSSPPSPPKQVPSAKAAHTKVAEAQEPTSLTPEQTGVAVLRAVVEDLLTRGMPDAVVQAIVSDTIQSYSRS